MFYIKGRALKAELVRRGKTARVVAERVGMSPFAFSRILNGHRRVDARTLEQIRRAIRSTGGRER